MVKISDIELPVIFKNQLLFKAGNWNHLSFSNDMVNKSVSNTKWSSLNKRLYLKHENQYDISQWKGKVENINSDSGEVRGDVEIWDANEALQILHGNKPIALSADIEYNDEGIMYFTGFALEADPGVRDVGMFLSDTVKNELSGMYHAKFSNIIDTQNPETKELSQTNQLNNQSTERRLLEDKPTNMTEKIESVQDTTPIVQTESKQEVQTPVVNPVSNEKEISNESKEYLDKVQILEARLAELENKVEVPKEQPTEVKKEVKPVENKATVVEDKNLSNPIISDNMVDTLVDKIADKIKPLPVPMTLNEFGGNIVDTEEETVNRLVDSLAKI